jgi:hypothetical protein
MIGQNVGYQYPQAYTKIHNKSGVLLQITGGKEEPILVFMLKL